MSDIKIFVEYSKQIADHTQISSRAGSAAQLQSIGLAC